MIYKAGNAITLTMLYLLLFLVGFLTDVCQSCGTGYYSLNGECQKCPKNCASCESASSCTLCHTGYHGETCSKNCPVYCHNSECNQISGQCLSCKEGYYDENKSCSKCPENCATCNSKQFCFTCRSGYKGEYCQSICSSCKPGTSCDKFTGYCHVDCDDGFSGELCDTPCDYKCDSCNRYKRHECISCASDRHGPSCDEQCSRTCDLNSCDFKNGRCLSGCIDGYWGEMCEQICSSQCNNQVCYQSNGECKDGCIDEFGGIDCSTRKTSTSLALIGGIIACAVLIVCVIVLIVYIIRKRRIKRYNSSLGGSIHHLLCTSDKTTKKPEAEPLKPLNGRQLNVDEDLEKRSAQTCEKANVNEVIFQEITFEPEKKNTFRASHVTKSMEMGHEHKTNVIASNTTSSIQFKASPDKQETVPLIHYNSNLEEKDKRNANKEILNTKMPLATDSNEKENTSKAENKPLTDTPIKKENGGTNMDRIYEKQIEERGIIRASHMTKSMERGHKHKTDVIASNTTSSIQFKASPDKQETVPLIQFTTKLEEKDKMNANKEILNMNKLLTKDSNEKENTSKAENKPLIDTPIKNENGGTNMYRTFGKQTEERGIVSNTEVNKNARLEDERILKTSLHENTSPISKRPELISPKKDRNNGINTSQGIGNENNGLVENFDDNTQRLSSNVVKSKNIKTIDKASYNRIEATGLAQYVANKENTVYTEEFQELSKVINSIDERKTLARGHMHTLQTNIPTIGSPVILEDEVSANINANFINAGPYAHKAYISYMEKAGVISASSKRAFWKTVLQERCGTIVMLTTESYLLPEMKCLCSINRVLCSDKYYGDITVSCRGESHFGSFTVREFTVMQQMMERTVQRLHFTKWPLYELPDVSSFVDFVKYANEVSNQLDGPTMVYCSSGKERTGVYIALDILTKQGNDTGFVDIFVCVRQLREQRVNMINDCEQYKFLHKALAISLSSTSNK